MMKSSCVSETSDDCDTKDECDIKPLSHLHLEKQMEMKYVKLDLMGFRKFKYFVHSALF